MAVAGRGKLQGFESLFFGFRMTRIGGVSGRSTAESRWSLGLAGIVVVGTMMWAAGILLDAECEQHVTS